MKENHNVQGREKLWSKSLETPQRQTNYDPEEQEDWLEMKSSHGHNIPGSFSNFFTTHNVELKFNYSPGKFVSGI